MPATAAHIASLAPGHSELFLKCATEIGLTTGPEVGCRAIRRAYEAIYNVVVRRTVALKRLQY